DLPQGNEYNAASGLWKWNWQTEVWEQVDADGNVIETAVDPFASPDKDVATQSLFTTSYSGATSSFVHTKSVDWDDTSDSRSFLSPDDVAAIEEGAAAIAAEAAKDAALVAAGFSGFQSNEAPEESGQSAGDVLSFMAGNEFMQEQYRAVAEYEAVDAEELSLQYGDTILVRQMDDSGWWEGRNLRTNDDGWFPCTFIVTDNDWVEQGWGSAEEGYTEAEEEPAATAPAAGKAGGNTRIITPPQQSRTLLQHPATAAPDSLPKVRALGAWDGDGDDAALPIEEGDEIFVTAMNPDGWWQGYTKDETETGYFPVTYVEWMQSH
ncbi:unnamed protein product, partial [Symbiodinium sp. KB8]